MLSSHTLFVTTLLWLLAAAAGASTLKPPVLPLNVRNPYLSTWLRNAREAPWHDWPIFWTGQKVGMSFMAYVPKSNSVYPLLGRPQDSLNSNDHNAYKLSIPRYLGATFDASTTNFTYHIPPPSSDLDSVNLTLSFFSPITPTSSMRQAIPASYVSVTAQGGFDVNIYMDINGDWVSGNADSDLQWFFQEIAFDDSGSLWSWQIQKEAEQPFVEYNDRAEWGKIRFSSATDVRYQSGSSDVVRETFAKSGRLNNEVEQDFRRINDNEPVFAFSKSFPLSSGNGFTQAAALFTIAHVQEEVVQFASARGLTLMRPLWKSWFASDFSLVMFHFLDYYNAKKLAGMYSSQVEHDAFKAGGSDYVDIVSLSARQVLGATSFSGTKDNPLIFLKEISSNGNSQTVDVIFPAYPFFMYTNPRWLAYLLEPHLEHQLSGQYPNKYAMHDLGAHFPNLTGHADGNDEYMPVEECGDILIMGLSIVNSLKYASHSTAQSMWSVLGSSSSPPVDAYPFPLHISSSDEGAMYGLDNQWGGPTHGDALAKQWLSSSYSIWKQWTEYLIDESLEPGNQLSTDDFAGWLPLQTNLALKGIVGIKAMSELASAVGNHKEASYYKNISDVYIKKWQGFGMSRDGSHAKLAYHWYGSWTTLYSLFADAILCFHTPNESKDASSGHSNEQKPIGGHPSNSSHSSFIPHGVYSNQSKMYELVMQKYGLPLDSRHLYTKSDWALQVAAVASPSVKKMIIHRTAKWLNETDTDLPFTDLYETEENGGFGAGNRFTARPVVGSHFSLLALDRACGGSAWNEDAMKW